MIRYNKFNFTKYFTGLNTCLLRCLDENDDVASDNDDAGDDDGSGI